MQLDELYALCAGEAPWYQSLYFERAGEQPARYRALLDQFRQAFPQETEASLLTTPGRTEISGNHTDHNHGRVLAGAVDLDAIAVFAPRSDGRAVLLSHEFGRIEADVLSPSVDPALFGTSQALVRGVCAGLAARGWRIGGFSACLTSDVPVGSGLSSSAAFEVLLGGIQNVLYNDGACTPEVLAQVAQYAENVYFGKPSGLMDQMACACGGLITIDFGRIESPEVRRVPYDFEESGHALFIVNTGGSHADLTDCYAAVTEEMHRIARLLGGEVLAKVSPTRFYQELPRLREQAGDRAVLRAIHFFAETERVAAQARALERRDFDSFLELVRKSGRSSFQWNQNAYAPHCPDCQPIPVALAVSEHLLGGQGAVRLQGGGFAGTIQAFVPLSLAESYTEAMERIFGAGSCRRVNIRPQGVRQLV